MLLAIDPGKDTGWATFDPSGILMFFGLGFTPTAFLEKGIAVIEKPQIYTRAKSKGNPNDLITLAIQVGELKAKLEGHGWRVELVLPSEWKGQTPKEVTLNRVKRSLRTLDRDIFERIPKSKQHNVADAIELGRWYYEKNHKSDNR